MRTMMFAVMVVGACGGSDPKLTDAPPSIDAAADDAPGDAPAMTCGMAGPAEMTCNGICVDTSSDPRHCGDCTTACSGATSCAGSRCVAPLTTVWEHHYGGDAFGYHASAVAVDSAGNTYVTGALISTVDLGGGPLNAAGFADIFVVSYAPNGAHRWSKRFGAAGDDQGAGITVDANKVYVTGAFSNTVDFGGGGLTSAGSDDAFVLTLSSATGAYIAARAFGTPGLDAGLAVAVDATGNVTVGGYFAAGTLDFGGSTITGAAPISAFVASASPAGAHRWSRRLSGTDTISYSQCNGITVDGNGNVTVDGSLEGSTDLGAGMVTSAGNDDVFVASYSSTGTPRWSRVIGGLQDDSARAVASDTAGNVVVGGFFGNTVDFGKGPLTGTGLFDGFVMILDGTSGTTRFARKLGAATSGGVFAVGADPAGNAVATGRIEGAANLGTGQLAPLGMPDVFVAGFDKATGAARFARRYGGTEFDSGIALGVAPGGAMAVAGGFVGTANFGLGPVVSGPKDSVFVTLIAP
jgi:hypothetical protein